MKRLLNNFKLRPCFKQLKCPRVRRVVDTDEWISLFPKTRLKMVARILVQLDAKVDANSVALNDITTSVVMMFMFMFMFISLLVRLFYRNKIRFIIVIFC